MVIFCIFEIECLCSAVAIFDIAHDVENVFHLPQQLKSSGNRFLKYE